MWRAVFVVLTVLPALSVLPAAQLDPPLTDREVQLAIDAGLAAVVRPVELPQSVGYTRDDLAPIVAVAYSPQMLIGSAARMMRDHGRRLSVSGVPAKWRQRIVYVAFRSGSHVLPTGDRALLDTEAKAVLMPERDFANLADETKRIQPLWLLHDPQAVFAEFGIEPPYANIAMVAAFPLSALQPGRVVMAYRRYPSGDGWALWCSRVLVEYVEALSR